MKMSNEDELARAKKAAAEAGANYIKDDMIVGLGTGSTACYFISCLAEKCRRGLKIQAIATSEHSTQQALKEGIPLIDHDKVAHIDIAVDGADEIDDHMRLIKGGGGAATREKIIARMSKQFIVIADYTKRVVKLGKFPLAVEILPFCYLATLEKLTQRGYSGRLRTKADENLFVTDNGNYIYDISLQNPCLFPEKEDAAIKQITGVVETGFFLNIATRIIIGFSDERVEEIHRDEKHSLK